ncbi:EamA family transporter RarD [Moraxella catarrhalis]|uniref:EamA-like transporter family protein n=2 Tax=Bacteria TaxID=2 RepID=A0A3A9RMG5_MORCA|nr:MULTISPECIES: EamA family transporter RarD [Moraxella]ARB67698.1 EamA family transporter RarD [Moraxella catarrhalis]ARE65932.1 EamA family transporter [Moraxella catarrhalis]AXT96597.1 chloramphenical resistance permease RarD [Moraxella catarrhalis]AZQ88404.1 eamA-like transporter family protein [Moraxella catarrhalis]AZQ93409.1 eamA-like transporter family protein [Moraxella catarrhalis]
MAKTVTTTPKGLLTVLSAFLIWGCFPLYFKELIEYDAIEIIVHRVVWTFVILLGITIITRRFRWIDQIKKQPKWLFLTFLASVLIATNWLVYVWAVTHDQVLEASLGYFIHPLVGVLFSMLIFKEKLRLMQKLAVLLAAAAVGIQIVWMGGLPWVSMLLPLSWGLYGVIQRQTPFDALDGLFLETALLVPISLIWLQFSHVASSSMAFWVSSEIWLLMLAGPVTLVPLLLYNISTKLVQFNTLSFLNYLTPSLIFLLAIFYYHEPFDAKRLLVFVLIWVGLLMFSADMFKHKKGA